MLLMGKSTISMAIFNSYVSLPEGMYCKCYLVHILETLFGTFFLATIVVILIRLDRERRTRNSRTRSSHNPISMISHIYT